ncbi:hypothetical protein [Pedococcus soli]
MTAADAGRAAATPDAPHARDTTDAGMRLWARILLVVVAHLALLLAIWWSWHPRVGDGNATPGAINPLLTGIAAVLFWAVLLQVSSRIPFPVLCGLFVLVPFCTFFLQHAGARWWTTDVMRPTGQVEVTRVDRLLNGASRVEVRPTGGQGPKTVAWSTIGQRRTNEYSFARISTGEHYELVTDPTGLVVPLIQPIGYRDSAARPDTAVWGPVTAAALVVLELVSASALTRHRSQVQAVDDRRRPGRRRRRRRAAA